MQTEAGGFTDDAVLVAALQHGDDAAFAWLLDRYSGPLRRLALGHVSSPAIAEEVVQDTWLGVIRGIDRFEGRSSLKTWIYRILLNVARSRGVRESRSIPFSSAAGALDDGAEPAFEPDRFLASSHDRWPGHWASLPLAWETQPEDRLLSDETMRIVSATIEMLPPAQREVITLRDVEGWSSVEICNALEITETNQRVLLHRARSKVRRALELHFENVSA